MNIRETTSADIKDILYIIREAFQRDSEANITRDMLSDPSAEPRVSLLAYIENQPVGYILFTHGYIERNPRIEVSFIAPLAVIPNFQIHEHHIRALKPSNRILCLQDYQPRNGRYEIPDLPGLGLDLNEEVVSKSPCIVVK